jgi:FAD/FMN-containing dehydrogenase
MPWNLQACHYPAAVVYPAFPDEVSDVLRAARRAGLRVAPQGTGHGAAPLEGRLSDSVLLRTAAMTDLRVDAERQLVRVGAGVLWGDLADEAGEVGLVGLHPSSPDVGVVGYSLGGGIGWYARQLGLQCHALTAAEVVLADGTPVRASEEQQTELFWGLRGGGVPLGVVTALEFRLFPLPSVVAGFLAWDVAELEGVLATWTKWASSAPDAATTSLRVLDVPPDLQEVPAELRGRRAVVIDGAVLGDDDEAADVLGPLRALRPSHDTMTRVPASSLVRLHLEPEGPSAAYIASRLLREMPPEAVHVVVDAVGPGSDAGLPVAEIRHLGGALARPNPAGALSGLDGEFLAIGLGISETDPARWPRLRAAAEQFVDALKPWSAGQQYLLMVDDRTDSGSGVPSTVHTRLAALRAAVDPDRLFVSAHDGLDA